MSKRAVFWIVLSLLVGTSAFAQVPSARTGSVFDAGAEPLAGLERVFRSRRVLHSVTDGSVVGVEQSGGFFERDNRNAIVQGDKDGVRSIRGLNVVNGPAHVSRLVVAIPVYAIDGVFRRRPLPNVCEKGSEAVARPPFRAHRDPPTAVKREILVLLVVATLPHREPGVVLRCACQVVRHVLRAHHLGPQATAAARVFQIAKHSLGAALAAAEPAFSSDATNHEQTAYALPGQVDQLHRLQNTRFGVNPL